MAHAIAGCGAIVAQCGFGAAQRCGKRRRGAVAGALGIRLGGPNDYFGQRVEKPWIGEATRDISVDDISRTIRLMWVSSTLALALFMAVRYWLVGAA